MRISQIEAWTLDVVDRVGAGSPVEDARVELKAEWPDPAKAARRIAGHANAARGDSILWVIGVDEKRGVVGADRHDLASWYPSVLKHFDAHLGPELTDVVVTVEPGRSVVALLFDSSRSPFVVKNPAHNQTGGGPVSFEVPWREGTEVRSARRSELLRLLVPRQEEPEVSFFGMHVAATPQTLDEEPDPFLVWSFTASLYVTPRTPQPIVLPFHRCKVEFSISGLFPKTSTGAFMLAPGGGIFPHSEGLGQSQSIRASETEAVLTGPGMVALEARSYTPLWEGHALARPLEVMIVLRPALADRAITVPISLSFIGDEIAGSYEWD